MMLLRHTEPAVRRAQEQHPDIEGHALVAEAVKENVWQSMAELIGGSRFLGRSVAAGELNVIGAVYDIDSGAIEWLGPHPQQARIAATWSHQGASHP
jgi:carbonic anhydrase